MKNYSPVYGTVRSWRYGNSLGIDPIGMVSTCSFNCVYCQLGEIERLSLQRQTFIPTAEILELVNQRKDEAIDVITLSGSGEPTLALNLGEIIAGIKLITSIPVIILTNGSLLGLEIVRSHLALANEVSIKLDGITPDRINQINRPSFAWDWQEFWQNLLNFRTEFTRKLTIQTMLVSPWSMAERQLYIDRIIELQPDRIYLNNPRRPKPQSRLIAGRENLTAINHGSWFKPLSTDYLIAFAQEIRERSSLTVNYVLEEQQ